MFSLGRKEQYIILVLIGVIVFGVGVKFALAKNIAPKPAIVPKINKMAEQKKDKIFVHISGAVQKPGLYEFTDGARVKEAIDQAIPTDKADIEALNLAEKITDGAKIVVPEKGQAQAPIASVSGGSSAGKSNSTKTGTTKNSASSTKLAPGEKVNINHADSGQLDKLPGVGPSTAQKIIDYRNANGGFKSIEEIKQVPGIGDKKFNDLKDYIII